MSNEIRSMHVLAASVLSQLTANTLPSQESDSRAIAAVERSADIAIQRSGIGRRFWGASLGDVPRSPAQAAAMAKLADYCRDQKPQKCDMGDSGGAGGRQTSPTTKESNGGSSGRETGAMAGDGIMLIGDPGAGKTYLLAAALREMARHGKAVKYLTVEGFFVGLRGCMGPGAKLSESEYLASLKEPDFLVLDDLQYIQDGESYQRRMLWLLLDMRYADCRATLTASNRTIAELRDMFDQRTLRRFEAEVIAIIRGGK